MLQRDLNKMKQWSAAGVLKEGALGQKSKEEKALRQCLMRLTPNTYKVIKLGKNENRSHCEHHIGGNKIHEPNSERNLGVNNMLNLSLEKSLHFGPCRNYLQVQGHRDVQEDIYDLSSASGRIFISRLVSSLE